MTTVANQFSSTIVGALSCQKDSYLKTLQTLVINCQEIIPKSTKKPSKKLKDLTISDEKYYEIELEDTVLFPEGGGQPSDTGSIKILDSDKIIPVNFIKRDGLIAKHQVFEPINPGTSVSLSLDWSKRFDHMQQHTGQHLISAIFDKYNLPTLSWKMGTGEELLNYLELPRKLSEDEVVKINEEINDKIMENLPIKVEVPVEYSDIQTRKMPKDYDLSKGVLRIIHIGTIDSNTCCGTHLSSTGQISSVVLLHQVNVKGGHSRIYFTCGNRVTKYCVNNHGIIKKLMNDLNCQPEEFSKKVELLNNNNKSLQRSNKNLLEELSNLEIEKITSELKNDKLIYHFYLDKSLDFINLLYRELSKLEIFKPVILISGTIGETGSVIVFGGEINQAVEKLKECFEGTLKGGGKSKWQGKIMILKKLHLDKLDEVFN